MPAIDEDYFDDEPRLSMMRAPSPDYGRDLDGFHSRDEMGPCIPAGCPSCLGPSCRCGGPGRSTSWSVSYRVSYEYHNRY